MSSRIIAGPALLITALLLTACASGPYHTSATVGGTGYYDSRYDDFYFYPNVGVYFSIRSGDYWYRPHGHWTRVRTLPSHIHLQPRHRVKLRLDHDRPYRHYDDHRRRYHHRDRDWDRDRDRDRDWDRRRDRDDHRWRDRSRFERDRHWDRQRENDSIRRTDDRNRRLHDRYRDDDRHRRSLDGDRRPERFTREPSRKSWQHDNRHERGKADAVPRHYNRGDRARHHDRTPDSRGSRDPVQDLRWFHRLFDRDRDGDS
ncbi:hypothetical protein [Marinobacterium aestuariivivens]|uniref:Uncharacterized protein n=1 Tax=Marinobacterium aestuariivivens TaxID=1698799 RepID=A0ABW2A2Y2_9GAMM